MISGNDINELVALLQRRQVLLCHACQYNDFVSYLKVGGVPSRAFLTEQSEQFTSFETDATDQQNDVWDKVFVNLSDFGYTFANGGKGVPNPYGPVLLKLRPSALLEATDVAVCLRSAGASGFDRQREALGAVEEIDNLFKHPASSESPRSTYVKYRDELRMTYPGAADPEISCSVPSGRLSLSQVAYALADPYVIAGHALREWAIAAMRGGDTLFRVYERRCGERLPLYNEIAGWILRDPSREPLPGKLISDEDLSEALKQWATEIEARGLDWQFKRFATYLYDGTLKPLAERGTS